MVHKEHRARISLDKSDYPGDTIGPGMCGSLSGGSRERAKTWSVRAAFSASEREDGGSLGVVVRTKWGKSPRSPENRGLLCFSEEELGDGLDPARAGACARLCE